MISDEQLLGLLDRTLASTDLDIPGAAKYFGKVRDNYTVGDRRTIVVSDRISAFDVVLGTIPLKGQVLNRMAAWWFEETREVAPNHVLAVPDPQVMIAVACTPLPVEFVMRAYLTGVTTTSIWHHYERGARRFCGHELPDGMKKNEALPKPILTPSTKAEKGAHDVSASRDEILAMGHIDAATFDEAADMAARLFAFGRQRASERGLILVDTKYEFGRALGGPHAGKIVAIDEIHTPDSSRYWYADDYAPRLFAGEEPRALDKEYVRRWYAAQGYTGDGPPPPLSDEVRVEAARRYITACEQITGAPFVGDFEEPIARITRNLGLGAAGRRVRVYVTLKRGVLDPQGQAVARALTRLGFDEVADARIGKYIELSLAVVRGDETERLDRMCRELLANLVIEEYRFEIEG